MRKCPKPLDRFRANALAGADTITFDPLTGQANVLDITGAGEDEAATGDLDITDELTIDGGGTASVEATGLGDRVLDVLSADVTITGLTVDGGTVPETGDGAEDRGGNIRLATDSTVDISDSTISNGTAPTAGGGIENTGGTLTATDTDFTGNEATGTDGGGGNGGAIHDAGGTVTVDGSTFTANTATAGSGSGGAILNNETDTALTVGSASTALGHAQGHA